MTSTRLLEIGADVAAIATACVALLAFCVYHLERHFKRVKLESYLKRVWAEEDGYDRQKQAVELSAALAMTEAEIIDAAFRSTKVSITPRPDMTGAPATLLFSYNESMRA